MISAKRLGVPCSINKDKFLLPLHQYEVTARQNLCYNKFDTWNLKQMFDFLKLLSRLSQEASRRFKDQREILVTDVTSEVWRRVEQ